MTSRSRYGKAGEFGSPEPRRSRTDIVYESLRNLLLQATLEPGSRLVEARVARDLGVSRTPIREALRRLESEGLVNWVPNGGFTVADFLEDLRDIFLIRSRLEGLAGFMAAGQITVEELEELEELQERMEHELQSTAPSTKQLISWNAGFHRIVSRASRSERLLRTVEQLLPDAVSSQIIGIYTREELHDSIEEHRAILASLWERDVSRTESLVQDHMMRGRKAMERLRAGTAHSQT